MKILLSTALISALLTGCATKNAPTDILTYRSPADAQTAIRDSHHYNIIGDYNHRLPVEPRPWRKLNDDQAPKSGANS